MKIRNLGHSKIGVANGDDAPMQSIDIEKELEKCLDSYEPSVPIEDTTTLMHYCQTRRLIHSIGLDMEEINKIKKNFRKVFKLLKTSSIDTSVEYKSLEEGIEQAINDYVAEQARTDTWQRAV